MTQRNAERHYLLCRIGAAVGAVDIAHVRETMRPLPILPIAAAPHFVLGLAIVRGQAIPVVDARRLVGQPSSHAYGRFISVNAGNRNVALAVDAVLEVRPLPVERMTGLPPLLSGAGADTLQLIGAVDSALLIVLETARLVPEEIFAAAERGEMTV